MEAPGCPTVARSWQGALQLTKREGEPLRGPSLESRFAATRSGAWSEAMGPQNELGLTNAAG